MQTIIKYVSHITLRCGTIGIFLKTTVLAMTLEDVLITFSRRDVLLIVGLGFVSVLLRQVQVLNLLLYPFWLFNTLFTS